MPKGIDQSPKLPRPRHSGRSFDVPKRELTMTGQVRLSRRSLLGLTAATAAGAVLGGCGDDDGGDKAGGAKKIRWWHIANTDPMLSAWAQMARQFEASHPGVKFEITPL